MNPDRLLTHFERLAESPDAIPRLRRFVLDLAVRGKLVEQDPNDEPASELLKRIMAEKARLAKGRRPGTFAPLLVDSDEEAPFDLPCGWMWVRLGNLVTKLTDGTHHSPPNGPTGEFKYITAKNIKNNGVSLAHVTYVSRQVHEEIFSRCDPAKGDVLYIKDGATTGVVTINDLDEPFSMLSSVALIKLPTCLFNRLIVEFLRSPFFYDQMRGFMKGAAITRVTLKRVAPALVPLPPLPEQHRIVAKVDELMALCDRLEAARNERESRRDRLVTASLHRLSQPGAEEGNEAFRADARFYLNHLPRLTTRPHHIKQLRQTILNLAVRGRLVPRDPTDEPASTFDRALPAHLEPPWDIPTSWKWARLHTLGKLKGGGTPSKARDDYWNGDIPWVSPKDMKVDYLAEAQMSISEAAIAGSAANLIEAGSVLFVVRGMILTHSFPVAVTRVPLAINQDMKALVLENPEMAEFLLRALKGLKPEVLKKVRRSSHGTCRLEGSDYRDFLIPIPPLAEQHRIVARVDELMALCDRLEANLANTGADSRRLLEAVLHEALAPVADRAFEAVA